MAVDVFRNDIEVAANDSGDIFRYPAFHLQRQAIHPSQLVTELFRSYRVAIRQVDVDDPQSMDHGLQKSRMAIEGVAGKRGVHCLDRITRQNRDTVICLLSYGHTFITESFEYLGGKDRALEFLQ